MSDNRLHRQHSLMTRTARALRSQMTFPESLLWSKLRSAQLGARFRRQHPIGGYVADFYCASAKLVVEIDGRSHDQTADADQARQADLERQGLRVIRYTNDEVLTSLDAVIADIFRHVNDSTLTQPSPCQGEGLEGASIANRQSALGNPPSTLTQPSPFQGEGFEGAPIGSRHSAIHPQFSLHPFQGEGSDSVSHQRADNS